MMEVVVTTGAISRAKLQSNHHHQQTNTQFFFTGRMVLLPNQQCQSTEGKAYLTNYLSEKAPLTNFHLSFELSNPLQIWYRDGGRTPPA